MAKDYIKDGKFEIAPEKEKEFEDLMKPFKENVAKIDRFKLKAEDLKEVGLSPTDLISLEGIIEHHEE